MKRTDIAMKDVFISWTGKDRELKDLIVQFLNSNGISCLESDESCSGDFREWSKEAVSACSVFLLILTESTLKSKYVPIEIEELKKLDDWENRVVPVCMNMELYQKHSWGLHESESAVILGNQLPTQEHLSVIIHKTIDLLIHRQYTIYCNQSNKEYATLTPLLGANKTAAKQYSYDSLYIPRSVTELDDQGQHIETMESPNELIQNDDILFISGPAGSGKTQYIHQIRKCADNNDLVISLPCAKMAQSSEDLLSCIYHEFERIAGIRTFYSVDNFKRLLNVKHLVLILDGMDEIATQNGTQKFVNKVDKFYASNSKNVTLIFTSRNADDANTIALEGKKLRRFVLNKLTDSQVSKLSENLFLLFGSADHNNEFYIKLKDLDEEIRSNPLLLSQLAIVYQNTGEIPQSVVGIYDAISKITFNVDLSTEFDSVPATYKEMLERDLSSILKSFSQERYNLLSQGKNIEITKVFSKILKEKYASESKARAEFLVEYLQNRSILIDGEFYHKMFLEYFTAVAYYEQTFDDYNELENVDILNELFAHYNDAYWSAVIKLFLVKSDNCIDESTTEELYDSILKNNEILEYTLLFDTCRDLIRHKEQAQLVLVCDILSKSVDGTYPPYGPLFWYVPEYELYETAVFASERILGNAKALALVRDVCVIFGGQYTVADITKAVDGNKLYRAAKPCLSGVREGLVALFCTGKTDSVLGTDVYPRCFNIEEIKLFMENGHGLFGRMSTLFEDELGLWKEDYPEVGGEYIGFVSCQYDKTEMERRLCEKSTVKVRGLALINSDDTVMDYVRFIRTSVRVLFVPENTRNFGEYYDAFMQMKIHPRLTDDMIVYVQLTATKITIPEGITLIDSKFCAGMSCLSEVILPHTVTHICDYAFSDCSSLTNIALPKSLDSIGKYAFLRCEKLSCLTFPDGLTSIGEGAFGACKGLVSIDMPDSITSIGGYAFYMCENLLEIDLPKQLTYIGENTFFLCEKLRKIVLPAFISQIDAGAFAFCSDLIYVKMPDSLVSIQNCAFMCCENLAKVELPNLLAEIGERAFDGCSSLAEITVPASVQNIGEFAFGHCDNLKRILIPISLRDCLHMFPEEVTYIYSEQDKIEHSAFFAKASTKETLIQDGITHIPADRFKRSQETAISLPDSVISIGDSAFSFSSIQNITLPKGLTELGKYAFSWCPYINEIVLPDTLMIIQDGTFSHCSGLKRVTFPSQLKEIQCGAFEECNEIESIVISDSVSYIGSDAFRFCSKLTNVVLPKSLYAIGKGAFSECHNLAQVAIPSNLEKIGDRAFEKCYSMKKIVFPETLICIGESSFRFDRNLSEICLPKNLRFIGDEAFWGCEGLRAIYISSNFKNDISRIFGDIDTGIIVWID